MVSHLRGGQGLLHGWETVVGLEVHAQVAAATKLFSGAPTQAGAGAPAAPNSRVAAFDAALPGTLPSVNWGCVAAAVRTGLALGGSVAPRLEFDRKHYFYPDLPHGFQLTQRRSPIVSGGALEVPAPGTSASASATRRVRIQQVQLETDTGKLSRGGAGGPAGAVNLDLNRAGTALMEIVTEPDLRSGAEAAGFVRALQKLLRHLGTCHGAMEDGGLRVDVNVSVRSDLASSSRREIKNLNSFKRIEHAVEYEARELQAAMEAGRHVPSETLGWDVAQGRTYPMRSKERLLDYRFMPEPDLPPVPLTAALVRELAGGDLEPPEAAQRRLAEEFGLPAALAAALADDPGQLGYFRDVAGAGEGRLDPPAVARFVTGDLVGLGRAAALGAAECRARLGPGACAELLGAVASGRISMRMAKGIAEAVLGGDARTVEALVEAQGGGQVSDAAAIAELCRAVLDEVPDKVALYRAGKTKLLGMFVGQVMKRSEGRANPQQVSATVKALLEPPP